MLGKVALALLLLSGANAAPSRGEDPAARIEPSRQSQLDIFEAAIRWRLAKAPLARGETLYLFLLNGDIQGLSARLAEYHVVVRHGLLGRPPPRTPWYWLRLGPVTRDTAFVSLEGSATNGPLALDLQWRNHRWEVVGEYRFPDAGKIT
jgi:hypothetical protein